MYALRSGTLSRSLASCSTAFMACATSGPGKSDGRTPNSACGGTQQCVHVCVSRRDAAGSECGLGYCMQQRRRWGWMDGTSRCHALLLEHRGTYYLDKDVEQQQLKVLLDFDAAALAALCRQLLAHLLIKSAEPARHSTEVAVSVSWLFHEAWMALCHRIFLLSPAARGAARAGRRGARWKH